MKELAVLLVVLGLFVVDEEEVTSTFQCLAVELAAREVPVNLAPRPPSTT